MNKKVFTPEEVEMLRANRYTFTVTPFALSFTKEFKELFLEEYRAGNIPRQILEKYGYPADVLGKRRIWGIACNIKHQYASPEGLHEGPVSRSNRLPQEKTQTTEARVNKLQGEIQYLRQEIEFLKKISSIRTTRK